MDANDLLVEVRNVALERVGVILYDDLRLEAEIPFNSVGTWTVTIAEDHPLAEALASPGGGIVVTDQSTSEVVFSGPSVQPERAASVDNVGGTITIPGVTDECRLSDALAWPDPGNANVATQSKAVDERTASAESLMHAFVRSNIGPDANDLRRIVQLKMGEDLGRGNPQVVQARFDSLLALCQNIAKADNLGFRVRQQGSSLVFETYLPRDNARLVRLSVDNNSVASTRVVISAPGATRAIVGGNGGSASRLFLEYSNTESLDAERAWGRRIERYVGDQSTRNTDQLTQAGKESLAQDGFTGSNAFFEPTDKIRESFIRDWNLGDRISVESNGKEFIAPVTSVIYKIDSDGLRVGAMLGDASVFSQYAALTKRIDGLDTNDAQNDKPFDQTPFLTLQEQVDAALEAAVEAGDFAATKNSTFRQGTPPTGGVYREGDIWFDTAHDNHIYLWSGTAWVDGRDAAIGAADAKAIAAQSAAANAATAASQANAAALTAQQSADGKNTVYYSTSAPGSTANKAGDTWFQRDSAGIILGQWRGAGGTTWNAVTLGYQVIASVDAGALRADSAIANNLTVAAKLTVGTSSILGSIESFGYDSASSGFRLTNGGITAKGGSLTGALVQTTDTVARGLKLTSAGLTAYDSSGYPSFSVDAATGSVVMRGSLTAGSDINGATVTGGTVQTSDQQNVGIKISNGALVAFASGSPVFSIDTASGNVTMKGSLLSGSSITGATMSASNATFAGISIWSFGQYAGQITAAGSDLSITASGQVQGNTLVATSSLITNALSASGLATFTGGARFYTSISLFGNSANDINGVRTLTANNANVADTVTATELVTNTSGTKGANAVVAYIASNGRIVKDTTGSSRRFKEDINSSPEQFDADAIARIETATFFYKPEHDTSGERSRRIGVIAEQVHDLGLDSLLYFEDDGVTPNGFRYHDLPLYQQVVIRKHHLELAELRAQVAELTAILKESA